MSKDFSKVLENAEKQVAGIKDEKYREIAFSKLVSHLLNENSSDNEDDAESAIPKATTKRIVSKPSNPATAKPKSAKSKESISIDKNLNLLEKGKISFKDFYAEKQPKSARDFNTVAIYYLSKILELDIVTPSQVYTCYKEVNKRPPDAFIQSLRDTANVKGHIDTADLENLKIPFRGVNFVDHDLPSKKNDGK